MTDSGDVDYGDMSDNPYGTRPEGDPGPGVGVDPVRLIIMVMLASLVVITGVLLAIGIEPWIVAIVVVGDLIAMGVLSRSLRRSRGEPA